MIRRFLEGRIIKSLTASANKIVTDAKSNVSGTSKTIESAISSSPVEVVGNDSYVVRITVDLDAAPHAGAVEYGSGLYGKKKKKYPIDPKPGNDHLAFPISRWKNYSPPPNVSYARFPGPISNKAYVMHPGIVAKPYMEPAIKANIKPLTRAILAAVGESFYQYIQVEFRKNDTK